MEGEPTVDVRSGDSTFPAREARLTTSISDLARANLVVALGGGTPTPDWWRTIELGSEGSSMFLGSVLTAEPERDTICLSCASGIAMTEVLMGITSAEDFPPQDVVYAGARAAGFPQENMSIQGLDELPTEPVEIVSPLHGIEIERRVDIGEVTLLPQAEGRKALEAFRTVDDAVISDWAAAPGFALHISDAAKLADAEITALESIDASLAWLMTRGRYGFARLPDGTPQRFSRESGRADVRRVGTITVRGLATGRRWLRDPTRVASRAPLHIAGSTWPPLTDSLSTTDRLALLAARQALLSLDSAQRAAEISNAFEYYAGDAQPDAIFEKADLKRLKNGLPEWLTDEQRRRVREVLGLVNQHSLNQRVRAALQQDGVRVTDEEWNVLQRVRRLRNRVAHGSEAGSSDVQDLELALSLLARALVHRMARIASVERGL